jgi:hypothetical protein
MTGKRTAKKTTARKRASRRWSKQVTEQSDALDLDRGVFALKSPRAIALSLRRSAQRSTRRKSDPYRSAMSMLTFYINRAGKNLSKSRRATLESAKKQLRELAHRAPSQRAAQKSLTRSASAHRS